MDDSLRLSLNQRQQQTLAPMQLQFVRMLEMNGPEVEDEVRRALDDNPALVESEGDDGLHQPDEEFNESAEQMQLADYRTDDDIPSYRLESNNGYYGADAFEPVAVAAGEGLMESLMRQLAETTGLDDRDMALARIVVGNIDNNGYMTRSLQSLADDAAIQEGLDVSRDDVRRVWNAVRGLEPAGVGAVDLRDSLLLQLQRRDRTLATNLASEIVKDYFDLFSMRHFKELRRHLNVDEEQLQAAFEVIKSLDPKPGALLGGGDDARTRHITPDFLVETDGDDVTLTLLNHIPNLEIERTFRADEGTDKAGRRANANAFIRQKREEATTFIRVLEMRQNTLFRIMSAIVGIQHDFFVSGDPMKLRPMILKDVSEITGDDVSVVSRATAGKYVMTQQGMYPLKFFFNERRKDNDDVSAHHIVGVLRGIIAGEDKQHPFSDEELAARLQAEGYDVARRTVAKYREKYGIPSGRMRKEV